MRICDVIAFSIQVDASLDINQQPVDISRRFLPFPYHDLLHGYSLMSEYDSQQSAGSSIKQINLHDIRCRDMGAPTALKLVQSTNSNRSRLNLHKAEMWGVVENMANNAIFVSPPSLQATVDKRR